ncbi:MAG: UDP-N-acetylmuramoyl-L-alanyl-D-glutamate--2,6-diaminopimelate ligase [Eubacteriaceae bacterium]
MELEKIISDLNVIKKTYYVPKTKINGIEYHSQKIKSGDLFVAIKGFNQNGHFYISNAISNGAKAIVFEDSPEEYIQGISYIRVKNTRSALAVIAKNFYMNPSKNLKVVGVTGTNGKTTTTFMLKSIFDAAGNKNGLIGTINNYIGNIIYKDLPITTPESLEIQEIMAVMKKKCCKYAFLEASSQGLALERVNEINFDYNIFTNLTRDHLDFHEDIQNYYFAKRLLFYKTTQTNIINIDDPWGRTLFKDLYLDKNHKTSILTYGIENCSDFIARDLRFEKNGTTFTLKTHYLWEDIFVNIPGKFMVYNALAAIAVAISEGISMEAIKDGLKNLPTINGRMQTLNLGTDFEIIIDFAHSPDSLEQLLRTIKSLYKKRIVLVFGSVGDRDQGKRPIMGEICGKLADTIIITSDSPGSEEPLDIIKSLEQGVSKYNHDYHLVLKRKEGIKLGVELCNAGDILIVTGRGHIEEEILKNERLYYTDFEAIKEAVESIR